MAGELGFVRRALRTKVVLEHTPEMVNEELHLRGSALVFTVSGTCPRLSPGHIRDGLLTDFPELPPTAVQISLMHPGTFFARFSERRVVRGHHAEETASKQDLSYFVVEAWVDRLEDVPTEATIDIHEPLPCVEPLAHADMPLGFASTHTPVPGAGSAMEPCNLQRFRECPPRLLSTTVLVHLDSSTFMRPALAAHNRWTSRDDDSFDDGNDETTLTEEETNNWTHGVADDVWAQRLEASSAGSAAEQYRPRRQGGGGRRRALTPAGFHTVPLEAPRTARDTEAAPAPLAVENPNGEGDDGTQLPCHGVAAPDGANAVIGRTASLVSHDASRSEPSAEPAQVDQLASVKNIGSLLSPVLTEVPVRCLAPLRVLGEGQAEVLRPSMLGCDALSPQRTPSPLGMPRHLINPTTAPVACQHTTFVQTNTARRERTVDQVDGEAMTSSWTVHRQGSQLITCSAGSGGSTLPPSVDHDVAPSAMLQPFHAVALVGDMPPKFCMLTRQEHIVHDAGDAAEGGQGQARSPPQPMMQTSPSAAEAQLFTTPTPPPRQLLSHGPNTSDIAETKPLTPTSLLRRMAAPIEPALLSRSRSLRRARRSQRSPTTATRRSHRVKNRKLAYTCGGNQTMK
ncbi:hypothetical protein ACQ4PT_017331 [Festuca glaucescens]